MGVRFQEQIFVQGIGNEEDWERIKGIPGRCPQEQRCEGKAGVQKISLKEQ